MVGALNRLGLDAVCFGNHEKDVGNASLAQRIHEFKGVWLNSNMPGLQVPAPSGDGQSFQLPRYHVLELQPEDGSEGGRKVAIGGFTLGGSGTVYERNYYEPEAFLGAAGSIVPTLTAAQELVQELKEKEPEVCCLVPLTHQDMPEDVALAGSGLVPVVIGGHDHEVMQTVVGDHGCTVIKGGMDAEHAVIVDLEWHGDDTAPVVTVELKNVDDYEPDDLLQKYVEKHLAPVRELEVSVIYELPPGSAPLSSERVRFAPSSVATLLCDAVRSIFHTDAALLNAGGFKGFTTYSEVMTFSDMKKEVAYPTEMVILPLPATILQEMVAASRALWTTSPDEENNGAYQVDSGLVVAEDGTLASIAGSPVEEEKIYRVAISSYNVERDPVLPQFFEEHPEARVAGDSGRGLLELLVEYFCGRMWRRLLESGSGQGEDLAHDSEAQRRALYGLFLLFDKDMDGDIEAGELQEALTARLGGRLSSSLVAKNMIQMVDVDEDGEVSVKELAQGLAKILQTDVFGSS
uniref:EF-hand domain-containing protein n=1 Tax=Rhizochromulina marina TaxID=1034831 RepID=A0A7S2WK64_9STRA